MVVSSHPLHIVAKVIRQLVLANLKSVNDLENIEKRSVDVSRSEAQECYVEQLREEFFVHLDDFIEVCCLVQIVNELDPGRFYRDHNVVVDIRDEVHHGIA